MKLFRKTSTLFFSMMMSNKKSVIYLVLILAPLFFAFREQAIKENEKKKPTTGLCAKPNEINPESRNLIFQSTDGGQTWQDISPSLPVNKQPDNFFVGTSDLYLRIDNEMYRSKSNLRTPVWEKEKTLNPRCNSIAFNPSGVTAFNYEGLIFQKAVLAGNWQPMYNNVNRQSVRTVFEGADGTVFLGSDNGLYKSSDTGHSWKHVHNEGWVMDMVESKGVLLARGQKGIMRSTDNGDHWEWVISEGGVGIAVERIRGGFAAIAFNTLTNSRRIHISTDNGKTWTNINGKLEPSMLITSIKQVGEHLICGHPDGIFRSSDLGKTWTKVHDTVNGKIFDIHVSGDVLYAVAGDPGC